MANAMRDLCQAPGGQAEVLQGNLAFAAGCVRAGIHAADGYPGTPSSEVIDRGLAQVQDLIKVGWSVNEAVAAGVGHGHSLAGRDCVVTMKIPGLYQAGDIFTSGSLFVQERGALIYYIASDFTPSSTQHTLDPRYLFKSCFTPVFEPRNHQELHEAAGIALEISRRYKTQVVIMPNGNLCHSEGLVHLMPTQQREPLKMPESLRAFNVLPGMARKHYDTVMRERMPALVEMVENSPLNRWEKGAGKLGVITYGINDLYVREIRQTLGADFDLLSLAFTNPLPLELIRKFCASIEGEVFVIEDGYRYLQEAIQQAGMRVSGKEPYSPITEWTPGLIAEKLGLLPSQEKTHLPQVVRPPLICAGCPYRLFTQEIALLRKKKQLDAVFGDIGCNALLYFMGAMDTGLAMGASEAERTGYVVSRPEQARRCLSIVGDSTECHSGMDATRNAIYRNVPGVKVILDNAWTGMTGGQPSPTSPANLAGESMKFDLPEALRAHGAKVVTVGAYDKAGIRKALKTALAEAGQGVYTTLVVNEGVCIQKVAPSSQRVSVDPAACKKCSACLICPGLDVGADGVPLSNTLCSGCGGQTPACAQMCPSGVLKIVDLKDLDRPVAQQLSMPPEIQLPHFSRAAFPERIALAIRGVGGQGNLFFGHVLSQFAFLAGYGEHNILKGETHGMAQMGGPVISTFGCGAVSSPVLLPGSADCLIALEKSEVTRPGFLEMLKPGGTILLASTQIIPFGLPEGQYPRDEQIMDCLAGYSVIVVDPLKIALELGDPSGRTANVVMLGVLSTLAPFNAFPSELWLKALQKANPKPAIWAANYAAFNAGRVGAWSS
jgi:indolepyruvate ferredoxin oxidoreductase alpha subunit